MAWGYNKDEVKCRWRGTGITKVFRETFRSIDRQPGICSSIWRHAKNTHRSFIDDGLVLAAFCRCALSAQFEVGGGRNQKWPNTYTFEYFEDQDEVSSETSAFQREEVALTKPFLLCHVAEAYCYPCGKALKAPQMVNTRTQFRVVAFHGTF